MIVFYSLFLFVCLLCDMRTQLCVTLCHQFSIHTQKRHTAQQQLLLFTHLYFIFLFFVFFLLRWAFVMLRSEKNSWLGLPFFVDLSVSDPKTLECIQHHSPPLRWIIVRPNKPDSNLQCNCWFFILLMSFSYFSAMLRTNYHQ